MNPTNTVTALFLSAVLALLPAVAFAQDEAEPAGKSGQLTLDDLRTFTDVFHQARRNYVEPVDDKTLLDSAIRGMLSDLDPHSAYLAPEQFAELEDASRGRYSGVGVSLETGDQKIVVDAVINGSPADEAGINPGDIITAVDGRPVKGRFLPDAIDDMEGDPGSDITLTVVTPGGEERELSITREYIQIPSLGFEMLEESYGYFRITQFKGISNVCAGIRNRIIGCIIIIKRLIKLFDIFHNGKRGCEVFVFSKKFIFKCFDHFYRFRIRKIRIRQ